MAGVGELPPSMSQSMTGDLSSAPALTSPPASTLMSQSMVAASGSNNDLMSTSTNSLNFKSGKKYIPNRNQTSQIWFACDDAENLESRADLAAREKEREERVRRLKEQQEEDRRRKLEELKQHALQAQKFREQQEMERRRHIESLRLKDMDRRQAVEERRKELEKTELERKEAIIQKNRERESRLETQRRHSRGSNLEFAFGSSAPRMMEPRVDSASGYWGSRSVSGQAMFERSSASVDRETGAEAGLRSKRTASAHGLNMSAEGEEGGPLSPASALTAHRRRTDLVPTIVMPRAERGARTPGISRENSTASAHRPGSAMSGGTAAAARAGVRLRSAPSSRRPRPLSIATTGMTSSMYEERQRPAPGPAPVRDKSSATPKVERMKRARSVTSDTVAADTEDARSVSSSGGARTPARKTPSQVKAENAARKAKSSTPKLNSTPKSSLGNISNGTKEAKSSSSKTPSPAMSQDNIDTSDTKRRQSTPDIIKDNNRKNVENFDSKESNGDSTAQKDDEKPVDIENNEGGEVKEQKKIITSEEEAKARIAEKRREMKEQKEREAELERLRLEEEARQEEERLRQEEEEEKRLIALEEEARRAEEERIRKAIEEKEAEDRKKREEEERLRAEKEEMERKVKAEAERREAELQEKLKKEEEERLARKKRIEEIMARTRGKGATPKKEETAPSQQPAPAPAPPQQPPSLDTNVDPTKPDLLGDISDQVAASEVEQNNARNLAHSPDTLEKGALDSISSKSDENENTSPLITVENGDSSPVKKLNGLVEGTSFDQILELGSESTKAGQAALPPPIMAFEEAIQQQSGPGPVADLLS